MDKFGKNYYLLNKRLFKNNFYKELVEYDNYKQILKDLPNYVDNFNSFEIYIKDNEVIPRSLLKLKRDYVFSNLNLFLHKDMIEIFRELGHSKKKLVVNRNLFTLEKYLKDSRVREEDILDIRSRKKIKKEIKKLNVLEMEAKIMDMNRLKEKTTINLSDMLKGVSKRKKEVIKESVNVDSMKYMQPNTLERKDIETIISNDYSVTDKADGIRGILIMSENRIEIRNPRDKSKLMKLHKYNVVKETTIIDGEFVDNNNTFYGFDILYSKGKDMRNNNLRERYKELKKYGKMNYKFFKFEVKKFYFTNIFKKSRDIWNNRGDFDYKLDGLIYTPIDEPYEFDKNVPIYKWKGSHSIDVRLEYKNNYTYFHTIGRNKWGNSNNIYFNRVTLTKDYIKYGKKIDNKIYLGHEGKFNKKYKEKVDIVEVEYSGGEWIYLRKRADKEQPNAIKTIKSVLKAMEYDIDIETISLLNRKDTNEIGNLYDFTKDQTLIRDNWRKMNNWYKRSLISQTSRLINKENITLIDLGCGKGGDLSKWRNSNIKNVLGIDTSYVELYGKNGFEERLINLGFKKMGNYYENDGMRVYIVWGDISKSLSNIGYRKKDREIIKEFIESNPKSDIVSSMYSIHYLFGKYKNNKWNKSTKFINNYKNTLSKLLDDNGYFIGIILDGNKIKEDKLFRDEGGEFYSIKLKKGEIDTLVIGNRVWGGVTIEEPRISINDIKKYIKYEEVEVKIEESDEILLNEDERELVNLNYPFILKRGGEGLSLNDIKKLIREMIENNKDKIHLMTRDEVKKQIKKRDKVSYKKYKDKIVSEISSIVKNILQEIVKEILDNKNVKNKKEGYKVVKEYITRKYSKDYYKSIEKLLKKYVNDRDLKDSPRKKLNRKGKSKIGEVCETDEDCARKKPCIDNVCTSTSKLKKKNKK
jgi:hypothetical protein